MVYALIWIGMAMLLLLWSLAAWGLSAAAVALLSTTGGLSGVGGAIEALNLPAWLAPWVPPEALASLKAVLAGLGPVVEGLVQWLPMISGGITVAAWVVWALGAFALLLLGGVLHAVVAVLRRKGARPAVPVRAPGQAPVQSIHYQP